MKLSRMGIVAAVTALATAAPALAQQMTWTIINRTPDFVELEFISNTYNNRFWPGNDRVYAIDPWGQQSYTLNCEYGEQICYGAWYAGNPNVYWGGGLGNEQYCDDCCSTCGQGNRTVNLDP